MPVGHALIGAVLNVTYVILDFFKWSLIIGAVLSWLIAFGIVDPYNRFVRTVSDLLTRLTEPFLRPIRRFVPPVNGLDLSPMVLIFVIYFLQVFIQRLVF
jgi:YggT family protein